jgi:hypothetical protein
MEGYRHPGALGKNATRDRDGEDRQKVVISTKKLAKVLPVLHPLV